MRTIFFSIFIFIGSVLPLFSFAQTSTNIGLVEHTIWYSKDPFIEGDVIKIYTMLYNGADSSVTGTVEFYDGKIVLGKKDVTISAESAKDVFVSWTVTAGEHSISVQFLNPSKLIAGKYEPITVTQGTSDTRNIFVPKKVLSESKNIDNSANDPIVSGDGIVDTIAQTIEPHVPTPISATASAIDNFRETKANTFIDSKTEAKNTIARLNDTSVPKDTHKNVSSIPIIGTTSVSLEKPLAYISLFFWTLIVFIFSHKVIFYGLILVIFAWLIRFIWKRFRN